VTARLHGLRVPSLAGGVPWRDRCGALLPRVVSATIVVIKATSNNDEDF
jgi:hypothetical protein